MIHTFDDDQQQLSIYNRTFYYLFTFSKVWYVNLRVEIKGIYRKKMTNSSNNASRDSTGVEIVTPMLLEEIRSFILLDYMQLLKLY